MADAKIINISKEEVGLCVPPYLSVTTFPKRRQALIDLKHAKSIEALMEGAMAFSALYAKNATTGEDQVRFVVHSPVQWNEIFRRISTL